MSTFTLGRARAQNVLDGSRALGLRSPTEVSGTTPPGPQMTLVYTPDLTAPELALFNRLAQNDIQDELQALRDFRQLGRNAFIQLVQNDRDRMLYDTLVAQIIVTLNLTRDE